MKPLFFISALLLSVTTPAMAAEPNNCETIKAEIAQRIISNGVPESGFSLNIIARNTSDDQPEQSHGQEVGHCGNNQYKIIYQRH